MVDFRRRRFALLAGVQSDPWDTQPHAVSFVLRKGSVPNEVVPDTAFPSLGLGMEVEPRIALRDPLIDLLEREAIRPRRRKSFVNKHAVIFVGFRELLRRIVADLEV